MIMIIFVKDYINIWMAFVFHVNIAQEHLLIKNN